MCDGKERVMALIMQRAACPHRDNQSGNCIPASESCFVTKDKDCIYQIRKQAFDEVFEPDGNIRSCGREACKKLITIMQEQFPGVDFGNLETGCMNVENIKRYHVKGN